MRVDNPVERWATEDLLVLPFDQYQRQRQSAQIIESLRGPGQTFGVLDVGGGAATVRPFLAAGDLVVSVDPHPTAGMESVEGHGAYLPFADASFDFSLALDTLEHVQPDLRLRIVDECVRVARAGVILIGPFASPEATDAENLLFEFIRGVLGAEHEQLREHLINGLPHPLLIESHLQGLGYPYFARPSGYIHNWLAMMLLKHFLMSLPRSDQVHHQLDRYYNRHYCAADHRHPSYRLVLFIAKNGSRETLEMASHALATGDTGEGSEAGITDGGKVFGQLTDLAHLSFLASLASLGANNARLGDTSLQSSGAPASARSEGAGTMRQTMAKMEAQLRQRDRELVEMRELIDRVARGRTMRLLNALQSLRHRAWR